MQLHTRVKYDSVSKTCPLGKSWYPNVFGKVFYLDFFFFQNPGILPASGNVSKFKLRKFQSLEFRSL